MPFVAEGVQLFSKRINKYYQFELIEVANTKIKFTDGSKVKREEAKLLSPYLNQSGWHVLLDEKGKSYNSVAFSNQLQGWMNQSHKNIHFYVGGAFGFDELIYKKANFKLRLSDMTFSHQLIRLIFVEQLYRAVSIIQSLPYHNS